MSELFITNECYKEAVQKDDAPSMVLLAPY
jgi:hypothetical protein